MSFDYLTSKILILEHQPAAKKEIKTFLLKNNLVGVQDSKSNTVEIFKRITDLGAVFISESSQEMQKTGLTIAEELYQLRSEVPIFLRVDNINDLNKEYPFIAGLYHIKDLNRLEQLLDKYLFDRFYPMPLVHDIQSMSYSAISSIIKQTDVQFDVPYLVNDQVVSGNVLSLIPLESNWCRGTMMLQTTEKDIADCIKAQKTSLNATNIDFRDVNQVVSEITNMIWGAIKSRYLISSEQPTDISNQIFVPILINQTQNFVSLGTVSPHLCFKYTIKDTENKLPDFAIIQKLVFNLNWQPELYCEPNTTTDGLLDSGELELF